MKLKSIIANLLLTTALGLNSLTYPVYAQDFNKPEKPTLISIIEKVDQKPAQSLDPDIEHARSWGTVVYKGSEVLQVGSSDKAKKYVVIDGNIFADNRWIPDIHIRPIDDNQTLYIKGSIEYSFKDIDYRKPEFAIKTNIPLIFNPDISFDTLTIDGQKVDPSKLKCSKELSTVKFRIDLKDLAKKGYLNESALKDKQVNVQYTLRIKLKEYKTRHPSEFGTFEQLKKLSEEKNLPLLVKRYPFLEEKVAKFAEEHKLPYNLARAIFEFTRNALEYEKRELRLNIVDAIKKGKGDCDDYTKIMADLLKYVGIPAIEVNAYIRDVDKEGYHAFPMFALPLKDGSLTWILSDPTLASGEKNPDDFFQQKDRAYLLDLEIKVDNMNLSGDNLRYVTMISAGKPAKGDLETYDLIHDKISKEHRK